MTTITCANRNGQLIKARASSALPLSLQLSYDPPSQTIVVPSSGGFILPPPAVSPAKNVLVSVGVVLRVRVSQSVSAQFQAALSEVVYITPFGDDIGSIELTFAANRNCGAGPGAVAMISHYIEHRLLPTVRRAATVVIGDSAFRSYLIGMTLDSASEGTQLIQGTLMFKGWPK